MINFVRFFEKYFNIIINVFFILALFVLSSHIVSKGIIIEQEKQNSVYILYSKLINSCFAILALIISFYLLLKEKNLWIIIIRLLFLIISFVYLIITIQHFIEHNWFNLPIYNIEIILSIFIAVLSFSYKITGLVHSNLHPSLLFVLSFAMIIFIGSFLLMLPASTHKSISYIDALFTATSAVTVTGLVTLSTSNDFTHFGQIIIIILIQCGGLGILTFSNLFSLLFKSDSSFKNRILLGRLINESNSSNIFKTLFKIVFITLLIELIGAFLIYISIYDRIEKGTIFFSVFHAISAFCNAGFSILPDGLFDKTVRFNYFLQLIICWLIISGGLGYQVIINYYYLIKYKIISLYHNINNKKNKINKIRINVSRVNLNTKLVIRTTFILLILGTIIFYALEYNNTLKEHTSFFGKIIVSFFNAVTPRTAGFNNVNMEYLKTPTVLIIAFLMWIGASPGSTGGGIKTSTFALGLMGLFNHIKGKDRINLNWKEVPSITLNLVNSAIILSIFALGLGTFFLTIFEPNIQLKDLFFEIVSAYSTSGLSLGITQKLCFESKIIVIIVMFLGRVSFLTFLIGIYRQFFKEEKQQNRIYPKEKIYI